jgi:predicted DNA-binding transcriptional regulator YafY
VERLTERLIQVLKCLPNSRDDAIDPKEVQARVIKKLNRDRSIRTTQRDLDRLKAAKAADYLVDGNTHRWYQKKILDHVYLDANQAMDLILVLEHAARFGMQAQASGLSKVRDYAENILRIASPTQDWSPQRLTSTTRFITLAPAVIDRAILAAVQDALHGGHALKVHYRVPERGDGCVGYVLRPLGLSFQDGNLYLSCYIQEETWPDDAAPDPSTPRYKYESEGARTFSVLQMHRMAGVQEGVAAAVELPPDYDIRSASIMQGLISRYTTTPIDVQLRLSDNLHKRLTENPLSPNQVVVADGKGRWLLNCAIHDSQGLRLWLMSNADEIEVVAPAALRQGMREALTKALAPYADQ